MDLIGERDLLMRVLKRLYNAADPYAANQDGADDPRCGLMQPITVAEANELNNALEESYQILRRIPDE
jgi:hypothetical protein